MSIRNRDGIGPARDRVPPYRSVDGAVGGISALAGLGAAAILAKSLADLSGRPLLAPLVLVLLAVGIRGAVALAATGVLDHRQRTLRSQWRHRAAQHPASAAPELHRRSLAIERISEQPTLDYVSAGAATSVVGVVIVFVTGGWLSLLIVVALGTLSLPVYARLGRQSAALRTEFERRRANLRRRQLEILRSITDLRALGAVSAGADEIAAASVAENHAVATGVRVTLRSSLVTEFLSGVSVGLVAMVVGLGLWHHEIALFPALVAVLVTAEMYGWFRRVGSEFHRRDDARAARKDLAHLPRVVAEPTGDTIVSLSGVRTSASAQPMTFQIGPGGRVSVEGPSGSGKTVLLETVAGLREPMSGSVQLGAASVGLVRATSQFVDGTVRENVTLGAPIPDDEVMTVLEEFGASPRLRDLDGQLGGDGAALSSGECVQLSVARAVLAGAEFIVLDDVGANLDQVGRDKWRAFFGAHANLAVLEATQGVSVLEHTDHVVRLGTP